MKCKNCGQQNPKGARYCGYCQHELKSEGMSAGTVKIGVLAAGLALVVLLLVLAILLWPCRHEWEEANCTEAATCRSCGVTKGDPLGHIVGEVEKTEDIINAEILLVQHCESCGTVVKESCESIRSFLDNDEFEMIPDQFMERYHSILKKVLPNGNKLKFEAKVAIYNNDTNDEKLMYQIDYDDKTIAYLYCYDKANEMISFNEKDKSNIWCVVLRVPIESGESSYIALNVYDSLMAACDPNFPADEREQYVSHWSIWLSETLTKDGCLLFQTKNNILYREEVVSQNDGNFFYFSAYATMNLGSLGDGAIDYDQNAPSDNPNYDEEEAEKYIAGTWTAQYIIL